MNGGRAVRIETQKYSDLEKDVNEILLDEYSNEDTRAFHQNRFRYWLSWCDNRDDVDPYAPTVDDCQNYVRYLKRDDSSNRKIVHRIRSVRVVYTILVQENVVNNNPASDYHKEDFLDGREANEREVAENRERKNFSTITPDEYEKLLENVPAPRVRNQLVCKLMWQLHLRSEEVTTIRLEDIVDSDNLIHIKDAKKDETDKDLWFEAYYKDDLQTLLDIWRDRRREQIHKSIADDSEYLLITDQNPKMRSEHVSRIVKNSARKAGIQEKMYEDGQGRSRWKVTAHTLRRSSATYIANKTDYPIHMLSNDLNHRSVDTTKDKYVRDDPEERKRRRQGIDEL